MKIAIIGAGAAGCFAAANISREPGTEIVIFEKTGKDLQKVKVSGGGRCNVTHSCFDIPDLIERYPRGRNFLRKTLYEFSPEDTINWFGKLGVTLKTEDDGRMFPATDDSQTIINALRKAMDMNGVEVRHHKAIDKIVPGNGRFVLTFADKSTYTADRVLIAVGGFPKANQYDWIMELGHTIQSPVPSLFTFNLPKHPVTELMGVAVPEARVRIAGSKFSENGPVLITHWGLSGPAILRLSAWAARELEAKNYEFAIQVNWLNETTEDELRSLFSGHRTNSARQALASRSFFGLPKRLWEFFLWKADIDHAMKWADLPSKHQNRLIESLLNDRYEVKGKTTFKEEFVTCGGIQLSEVNSATMESRILPGLFFAGEILDVDGITGGFNFQHAWASGFIAAQNITR